MQIKLLVSFLLGALLSVLATAAPAALPFDSGVEIGEITAAQVSLLAPGTSQCTVSDSTCSTAQTAAIALNNAFLTYGLKTLGQKAGMIAYMAFESVDFAYNINVFPGRPGQGTKCMLMFPHLYNFALSFPELKPEVLKLSPPEAQTSGVTYNNYESLFPNIDTRNKIRELVLPDKYTFKCAPWVLTSYSGATCDKTTLNSGLDGFVKTMEPPCFSVDVTPERKARWCETVTVLVPSGMGPPSGC